MGGRFGRSTLLSRQGNHLPCPLAEGLGYASSCTCLWCPSWPSVYLVRCRALLCALREAGKVLAFNSSNLAWACSNSGVSPAPHAMRAPRNSKFTTPMGVGGWHLQPELTNQLIPNSCTHRRGHGWGLCLSHSGGSTRLFEELHFVCWQPQQNPTFLCDFVLLIFNRSKRRRRREEGIAEEEVRAGGPWDCCRVKTQRPPSRPLAPVRREKCMEKGENPRTGRGIVWGDWS